MSCHNDRHRTAKEEIVGASTRSQKRSQPSKLVGSFAKLPPCGIDSHKLILREKDEV